MIKYNAIKMLLRNKNDVQKTLDITLGKIARFYQIINFLGI